MIRTNVVHIYRYKIVSQIYLLVSRNFLGGRSFYTDERKKEPHASTMSQNTISLVCNTSFFNPPPHSSLSSIMDNRHGFRRLIVRIYRAQFSLRKLSQQHPQPSKQKPQKPNHNNEVYLPKYPFLIYQDSWVGINKPSGMTVHDGKQQQSQRSKGRNDDSNRHHTHDHHYIVVIVDGDQW